MTFQTPTTKEEMYEVLNDIYHFYHFQRLEYDNVTLDKLEIDRLELDLLTDEQLKSKAVSICLPDKIKSMSELKKEIEDKLTSYRIEITNSYAVEEQTISSIVERYKEIKQSANETAWKNGICDSSLALEKISEIEREKQDKIIKVKTANQSLRLDLESKIDLLEEQLSKLEESQTLLFDAQVEKKYLELKDKQDVLDRETKKYNSALAEKELRYENSIKNTRANLELRYLSIHEQGYTKDELIQMGYYNDAIKCVSSYYDSLDEKIAYQDIKSESNLVIYLDDYLSMIVAIYKTRAAQA